MVARPPVRLEIEPMGLARPRRRPRDRAAQLPTPWPAHAYPAEIETNRLAHYRVARLDGRIVAFAGIWLMLDEAHVTTFAVDPEFRRRSIGERLLLAMLDVAIGKGPRGDARGAPLEHRRPAAVREVRLPARRPAAALLQRRQRGRADHDDGAAGRARDAGAPGPAAGEPRDESGIEAAAGGRCRGRGGPGPGPRTRPGERTAPPGHREQLRRDRDRGRRGRAADPADVVASQVALHAATGGIVPEVAARAHLRWVVPVLDDAIADAGAAWSDLDAIAVTHGPGLAGSLLVGINFAKALAWVHDLPLIGVNHLEGHVYAAWLADRGTEPPEPAFPLVALVVSGGHTFLVSMTDHLTYRLLGTTVDDAAGEAFDKVGRLLGLGYPGGPAIQKAAAGATRRDVVFPRAWLGDSYDFSFSGLKTAARRIVDAARAEEGLPADDPDARLATPRSPSSRTGSRRRSWTCSSTKTMRAAEATGARSIVLGGGVAANSVLRERLAAEAERCGLPLIVPAARAVHGQRGDDRGGRAHAASWRGSARASTSTPGRRCRSPGDERPQAGARRHDAPRRPPASTPTRCAARSRKPGCAPAIRSPRTSSPTWTSSTRSWPRPRPTPGRRVLEIGPGLGILTGGLLAAGRGGDRDRARPGPRRAPALGVRRADRPRRGGRRGRRAAPHRGRRARPGAHDAARPPYDVVANLPYHVTSPILHRLLEAPPPAGPGRAHGPARGGRADRRAAGRDELPLGVRPGPRRRAHRVPRPADGVRARAGRRLGGDRRGALRGGTARGALGHGARTTSGGSSRHRSASDAR